MGIYGNKLVNTIATKLLWAPLSNFGRHVSHGERMNTFKTGVQRSRSQCTYMGINL